MSSLSPAQRALKGRMRLLDAVGPLRVFIAATCYAAVNITPATRSPKFVLDTASLTGTAAILRSFEADPKVGSAC